MFFWTHEGRLRMTPQTEHMNQAGDVGAGWGGHGFAPPVSRVAAVMAARYHDEGWRRYEVAPDFTADGRPADFLTVDRRTHARFYGYGVDFLEPTHPHATLLISMHASGLYRGRYGVDGARVTPVEELADHSQAFVTAEEARQQRLREELGLTEAEVWHDYRLLQLWDRISIVAVWGQDHAQLGPAPMEDGRLGDPITAMRVDPVTIRLDPYPFGEEEVHIPVRMFELPDRAYAGQDDWDAELAATRATHLGVRLVG
ncbi:DUF3891 family protein [Euzebya sp.]|uniref:DUF3891 family protein n=1 Tax=Euzebya sp. TaxID=1971409 RepID=UPI003514C21B